MRAVQVGKANGPLELVERDIPQPGPGEVRIKVQACGVCHSDSITQMGLFPGIAYPRVPGHEIAGVIDAVGSGVAAWTVGERAGVGWHGGHCGVCKSCRRGDFITCVALRIPGISYDGGYAEYMIAPAIALARIPADLGAVEAGPLLCAGITTFNSLRHSGAKAGDLVAVLGIGGLGHLGVQFAARMGFRTVAIARGRDKEALAKQLGAQTYLDSQSSDVAAELQKLGGAKVILATVTNAAAMAATIGGLTVDGKLLVVGVAGEPMETNLLPLVMGRRSIQGWPAGTANDSEDTMNFAVQAVVRPMIEEYPLERAAEAYARMMSGAARFRVVLTTGQ
jgi:D-arabinose 1-dehydrogenase-like Zn-dependent alcohol dehydrogenase